MTNPHKRSGQKPITIRDLYPHFTEEQLKEAQENLDHYIEIAIRVFERISADPEEYAKFQQFLAEKKAKGKEDQVQ